jgi:CheY-like chemotaxis protein
LSLSVLIVEDQPDVAESTAELLSLSGCQTQIAACGTEALSCVAEAAIPFDLVLLDLALSDVDGWQVARQLRKQTASKAAFFVAMTGYSGEEARRRSAEAGIDIHLVKPVPPPVLIRLIAWIRNIVHPRDYE